MVDGRTLVTAPGFCRTEGYYPPELSQGQYSTKSDVYSYGVVVLETYSGLVPYDVHRKEDKRLTEYLEDKLKSVELFGTIGDKKAATCAPYLIQLLHKIVSVSLVRHSKRAYTEKIMQFWNETNS